MSSVEDISPGSHHTPSVSSRHPVFYTGVSTIETRGVVSQDVAIDVSNHEPSIRNGKEVTVIRVVLDNSDSKNSDTFLSLVFRLPLDAEFGILKDAFLLQAGLRPKDVYFILGGRFVDDYASPREMNVVGNSTIRVVSSSVARGMSSPSPDEDEPISIRVDIGGKQVHLGKKFQIRRGRAFGKLQDIFARRFGVERDIVKFYSGTTRIYRSTTPLRLSLGDNSVLSARFSGSLERKFAQVKSKLSDLGLFFVGVKLTRRLSFVDDAITDLVSIARDSPVFISKVKGEDNGCTALHFAAGFSKVDECRVLIGKGVDVNARDDRGWTPLHHLAAGPVKQDDLLSGVAGMLCSAGADTGITNNVGQTALDLATSDDKATLAQFILSFNSENNSS